MNEKHQKQLENIIKAIDNDLNNNCVVEDLYSNAGIPERMFRDLFRSMYGCSPLQYINKVRYRILLELIENAGNHHELTAFAIAQELGFDHSTSLYGFVKKMTGITLVELKEKLRKEKK